MEKVIIAYDINYCNKDNVANEVNNYLANGWTVKSVTPVAKKDYANAIFVLEKK